ncbi:MAG: nucleotide exchange factor GrpE [Eubacteriales bacterium]|nr:nucleotide exchange factor GrpE [Eubacteriales bacterium]
MLNRKQSSKRKADKSEEIQAEAEQAQKEKAEQAEAESAELTQDAGQESEVDGVESSSQEPESSQRIADLEAENAKLNDRWLRLQAEYDNYRRRSQDELSRRYEDALIDVATAWLPVLDNLDRAEAAAAEIESADGEKVAEGIQLVKRQAKETMERLGITEIACVGESFDPAWHEALHHIETEDYGENEISQVFTKGYKKGERVIRHAQVQVAN